MYISLIVATKGRAKETSVLLDFLARQSMIPNRIVVVGAEPNDVSGLNQHALVQQGTCQVLLAPKPGLTIQRNTGIELLDNEGALDTDPGFVVFFDDDFRPATNWLDSAAKVLFEKNLVGLTGWVLADGIKGAGLSEHDAKAYLDGKLKPQEHWSNTEENKAAQSVYGCNMAFRNSVMKTIRFDESLPLYGWQEDRDFTGQVLRSGPVIVTRECRGVHMGVKNGRRQSGVMLGYSQIANPLHIVKRRNMTKKMAIRIVSRNIAANVLYSLRGHKTTDYPGRLGGNLRAVFDLLTGRCHPARILDL